MVHLLLDLALGAAVVVVAVAAPTSGTLVALVGHQPWAGLPLLVVSAVGLWLAFLALSALGALEAARRLVHPTPSRAVTSP